MKKKLKIILIALFVVIAAGASAGLFLFKSYNQAPEEWVEEYSLLVEPGMTISSIGHLLERDGIISSYYVFRFIHEIKGGKNIIPTGAYTLSPGMESSEVYEKLVAGEQDMISLTLPEGWTVSKIAKRLEAYGVCNEKDFLAVASDRDFIDSLGLSAETLEGYLFPDTYRFVYDESAENVARAMVENFLGQLSRLYPDWKDLTDEQLRNKITMASIIEKEYRLEEEAPLIASVFYNRLDSPNFPFLQSCATVVYVITDKLGKAHPDRLLYRDLEIESPYNTYNTEGLPPGAICSPGLTALDASFYPAQTNYVFFVVKDSRIGSHNFSSDYGDFLENKDNYLESFRSK
ncbi:MAG: endolytic transglycosylase MltG [Spirochaetales bacterium]|nr:endolytic transglycosylase MltG [Spirochaetales bacterium]